MPMLTVPTETLTETWGLPDVYTQENEFVQVLRNDIYDQFRWTTEYDLVFKVKETGKIYQTRYRVGSTECQEDRPWDYKDEVTLTEVEPFEKTIIDYRPVPD